MAQITALQFYGVPGRTRTFVAKAAAALAAIHILSTGAINPNHASDSGNNLLINDTLEVQQDLYAGGVTNYTKWIDGTLTLAGTARAWECLDLKPSTITHPLANSPDDVHYPANLFEFDAYDDTAEEQVFFAWHIPNDYCEGTANVRGHFGGMVSNENGLKYIAMGFQWIYIDDEDTFPDAFALVDVDGGGAINITIENGEGNYVWHTSQKGVCETTGWERGGIVLFRFFRDVDDVYAAVSDHNDNYIGDVLIKFYHLEFLRDRLGEQSV